MLRKLAFALVLFCSAFAAAQSRVECSAVKSRVLARSVRYCAVLPPSYSTEVDRKYPVLYYFHGLGESEQAITGPFWNILERLQQTGEVGDYIVVTPAAGRSFYVNSKDGRLRYEDFFIHEFLPAIERKFRVSNSRAGRAISGTSMGGYGALRMAFKHPSLFASVSAHMPALYQQVPSQFLDLFEAQGGAQFPTPFGTPFDNDFWVRNTPFYFARLNAAQIRASRLKIYFDCGDRDDFAFDIGANELDKLLTSLNIGHEFHIYPGGHDPKFIAEHLRDSLVFQSKVLTGK